MAGKIFVHIGLPKTATTTLQMDVFPRLASKGFAYLGVYQPRGIGNDDKLYENAYSAIARGSAVDETRMELSKLLTAGQNLIISEEMLAVADSTVALDNRITRLSELLRGLDFELIITVREPAAALFSFYVEDIERYYRSGMGFIEAVQHDETMRIFYYKKLFGAILEHFDKNHVHVFQFERIIKGELQGLCDLIAPGHLKQSEFVLENHNNKKNIGKYIRTNRYITVGSFLSRHSTNAHPLYASVLKLFKLMPSRLLNRIKHIRLTEIQVIRPLDSEMDWVRAYLRDETLALNELFGIKYYPVNMKPKAN